MCKIINVCKINWLAAPTEILRSNQPLIIPEFILIFSFILSQLGNILQLYTLTIVEVIVHTIVPNYNTQNQ